MRNKSSAVAEMGDRLVTIDMGRKWQPAVPPPFWGSWIPTNTMLPGPRPTSVPSGILIHPTVCHNRHRPKIILGLCPFLRGGAGCPSKTMWPKPMPTSIPSSILNRLATWPQYTNVIDRTDRQDRQRLVAWLAGWSLTSLFSTNTAMSETRTDSGPIAYGERCEPFYKRSLKRLLLKWSVQPRLRAF